MERSESDSVFTGSVPEVYDQYLVPLIFETYARDLADRVAVAGVTSVLEVAAGSGVVTRALADRLPPHVEITASDLNQDMIDQARRTGTSRPVQWRQADAMNLPFPDGSFDAVVCQFGVMFFPDRTAAFTEAARVLRPGGTFMFNTWDQIETNEFAHVVTNALTELWPNDPPLFLARTPHGYFNQTQIRSDLADGFDTAVHIEALEARSVAASCELPAIAYCQGTPLRNEIEQRDPTQLTHATQTATAALREQFGPVDLDSRIRGYVITATKPNTNHLAR